MSRKKIKYERRHKICRFCKLFGFADDAYDHISLNTSLHSILVYRYNFLTFLFSDHAIVRSYLWELVKGSKKLLNKTLVNTNYLFFTEEMEQTPQTT